MDKYQKLRKTWGNLKKIADIFKKTLKFETLKFETLKYWKPLQYYWKLYNALLSNLKEDSLAPEETQKMTKIFKKLVSFCVFVVPKYIAHKMVITGTSVSQKAFINFQILQPYTNQAKNF